MITWEKVTKEEFDSLVNLLGLNMPNYRRTSQYVGTALVETRRLNDGAGVLRQVTSGSGTTYFVTDSLIQCTQCGTIMLDGDNVQVQPCKACGGFAEQWGGYYVD